MELFHFICPALYFVNQIPNFPTRTFQLCKYQWTTILIGIRGHFGNPTTSQSEVRRANLTIDYQTIKSQFGAFVLSDHQLPKIKSMTILAKNSRDRGKIKFTHFSSLNRQLLRIFFIFLSHTISVKLSKFDRTQGKYTPFEMNERFPEDENKITHTLDDWSSALKTSAENLL